MKTNTHGSKYHHSDDGQRLAAHSLTLLEFSLVRERLASYASFPSSREKILALTPASTSNEIFTSQQETREARKLLESTNLTVFEGVRDIKPLAQRAAIGGSLDGTELWAINDFLKACRNLRMTLKHHGDMPLLSRLSGSLISEPDIEEKLNSSLTQNGSVSDSASSTLRSLKDKALKHHSLLLSELQRIVHQYRNAGVLQEPIITERNGRKVLLVRREARHRIPGITHGVSDSGSSAFVEPLETIHAGNAWVDVCQAIVREETRILQSLSEEIGICGDNILQSFDTVTTIDFAIAKGRYSSLINGIPPSFIESTNPHINLIQARHPLLLNNVIPIDAYVGGENTGLLITGPNAGGKTVALKTLGLLALMAHSGLDVPAKACSLTVFDSFYADIGDGQSIDLSLSSFTSHLQTLKSITQHATTRSFVLLDELGSSTDPDEGAALAKAVLNYFAEKDILFVATTHHRDVASFVEQHPKLINGNVGLHPKTLIPTYKLIIGFPGRSYAFTIAERSGIHRHIIDKARQLIATDHGRVDKLINRLEENLNKADQERKDAQNELAHAKNAREELEAKLDALDNEKAIILENTRLEIQEEAAALWKRLREIEQAFTSPASNNSPLNDQRVSLSRVRNELRSNRWKPPRTAGIWTRNLEAGDYVHVRGISRAVKVLSPPTDDTVELLLGSIRAKFPTYQLEKIIDKPLTQLSKGIALSRSSRSLITPELDLRGLRVQEAEMRLEEFLDQAMLEALSTLRVIHGSATGALREMVTERLKGHPLVKTSRISNDHGNSSVTIVELN